MIDPNPATIESILSASVQYVVPKYQREYTWGKNEALEFMEDLRSSAESENNLFLGTIIFDESEEKDGKIRVVDGQQRLTTILILLIACRNFAKKINAINIANVIQNKITFLDPTTAEVKGTRLLPSESIKDVFDYISSFEWDEQFPLKIENKQVKRQINRIRPIYDFFRGQIKGFDQIALSKFLKAIYSSYVVRINIQDEFQAFSIFERTNARGVDLEASDLLKNYLFSNKLDDVEEKWSQIIENSNGTLLRMLKYFYVSQKGSVSKSDLYRQIRLHANKIGPQMMVESLLEFSRYYSVIRKGDSNDVKLFFESVGCAVIARDQDKYEKIHISLEGLRLFKVAQIYPLINAALYCFIRQKKTDSLELSKKFIKLIEILEKYHFINNAICERIGNEVEKLYADYCKKYSESEDFNQITIELVSELKTKLAGKEEFVSRFTDITYSSESVPLICYIFDRINNYCLRPGERVKLFNPDQSVLRKNHNIEHFFPQNLPENIKVDNEMQEMIDNIGNLLVISFHTNSKLGNLLPDGKINKLKGDLFRQIQNQTYVKDFIEHYESKCAKWNKKVIVDRAKKIAEDAYDRVWKI